LLASHSNPSRESLKNGERGVRELFLGLGLSSARQVAREEAERVWRGYIYSSASKEPLGEGVPGDSGYMPGDSGQP